MRVSCNFWCTRRRAMTLLEVLVSLALLVSLGGLVSTWVRTASSTYAHLKSTQPWLQAATASLDLIERDLACGDFGATSPISELDERVTVVADELEIVTRATGLNVGGPVRHQYRWDRRANTLLVEIQPTVRGHSRRPTSHTLLTHVGAVTWSRDVMLDGDDKPLIEILTIEITHMASELHVSRRYRLQ